MNADDVLCGVTNLIFSEIIRLGDQDAVTVADHSGFVAPALEKLTVYMPASCVPKDTDVPVWTMRSVGVVKLHEPLSVVVNVTVVPV